MMKRVIVDTDPGIDDTAAILLALASPELSIEAVTTVYGNGTLEECARNALIIL
ncbi:MAG: nucleoside hydrolase [Nitrospinae bacterium]|nr:nucleoside hydrolase [Nitrospinota bacterium]